MLFMYNVVPLINFNKLKVNDKWSVKMQIFQAIHQAFKKAFIWMINEQIRRKHWGDLYSKLGIVILSAMRIRWGQTPD